MSYAKHWCGTINNPMPEDEILLLDAITDDDYLIYQYETGEEKTCHIQFYIAYEVRKRFDALKKLLPRAHLEKCKGTPSDNIKYCSKQEGRMDGPYEHGSRPTVSQGQRNSAEQKALTELILSGASLPTVLDAHPMYFLKYPSGIKTAVSLKQQGREALGLGMPKVHVYWGIPGSGKSWDANAEAKLIGLVHKMEKKGTNYWWDGYSGQPCVIFNDFYGHYPYSELLAMLDVYDNSLNVKGSMTPNLITHIWFTSNKPPWQWYKESVTGPWLSQSPLNTDHPNALERRVAVIKQYSSVYKKEDPQLALQVS